MKRTLRSTSRLGSMSRRSLLRGLGLSAAAAPFLPLLESHAAEDGYPLRLLLLFNGGGGISDRWAPSGTTTDFVLNDITAPLAPLKDKLVFIDGVKNDGGGEFFNDHVNKARHLWTGCHGLYDSAGGPSVDQVIADAIGQDTTFRSLEFGFRTRDNESNPNTNYMIWRGVDEPVPHESDPVVMFDRIFGDIGTEAAELEKLKARRGSTLDLVHRHLEDLKGTVSTSDAHRVEAHLEAIREMEKRNDMLTGCIPPEQGTDDSLDVTYDNIVSQIVASLSCDLTRVASLALTKHSDDNRYGFLGLYDGTSYHGVLHGALSNDGVPAYGTEHDDFIVTVQQHWNERVLQLLQALDAVPEGPGTLLDHTLVVWASEFGEAHDARRLPIVLAGGTDVMPGGRFLQYDEAQNHRLLVSLCNAFGLDVDQFGDTDLGQGPLPGLLG